MPSEPPATVDRLSGAPTGVAPPTEAGRELLPVLIFLGMVVAVVSSLGAPMIPTIAAVDHVSLVTAQWSLTITLLVGAVATPTMGRLGDGAPGAHFPARRPAGVQRLPVRSGARAVHLRCHHRHQLLLAASASWHAGGCGTGP